MNLKDKKGFSIIEAIVASSVFALLVTSLIGALMYSSRVSQFTGASSRATFLAKEGLEAARSIRDKDFANLVDGAYGLAVSGNEWNFAGTEDITNIFTRNIEITTVDANTKQATSNINWQDKGQNRSVSLTTYFTYWQEVVVVATPQADSLLVDTSGVELKKKNKELTGITIENIGATDITIDKITVFWNGTQKIEEIKINNTKVWSKNGPGTPAGNQPSGTELDIQDFVLSVSFGVIDIDKIKFNKKIDGLTFDITFIMSDGSQKVITGITP